MKAIITNNGIKLNCPVCKREVISKAFSVSCCTPYIRVKALIDCSCDCYGEVEFHVDGIIEEDEE